MNPEIKEKWISALRSGKYKQARNTLKKGNALCCLGVLCELHRLETKTGEWIDYKYKPSPLSFPEEGVLPQEVADWAGTNQNPDIPVKSEHICLGRLNDGDQSGTFGKKMKAWNFAQIADAIEASL